MSSVALDPAGWPGTLPPVSVLGTSELTDTDLGYLHALHEADRHTYEFVAGPTVPQVLRAVIEYGWDGEATVTYAVRAGAHADPGMDPDTIVAAMQVWYSNYDNLTNACIEPVVLPSWRHRGIGSAARRAWRGMGAEQRTGLAPVRHPRRRRRERGVRREARLSRRAPRGHAPPGPGRGGP